MGFDEYAAAIEIWEHTIGGFTHKMIPNEDDNYEFIKIKEKARKSNDETILLKGIIDLYFNMVVRSEDFQKKELLIANEDDKLKRRESLKKLIGRYSTQIAGDMLIALKFTTEAKLKEAQDRQLRIEEEIQKKKAMKED